MMLNLVLSVICFLVLAFYFYDTFIEFEKDESSLDVRAFWMNTLTLSFSCVVSGGLAVYYLFAGVLT